MRPSASALIAFSLLAYSAQAQTPAPSAEDENPSPASGVDSDTAEGPAPSGEGTPAPAGRAAAGAGAQSQRTEAVAEVAAQAQEPEQAKALGEGLNGKARKDKKKKQSNLGEFLIKGRVFVLSELSQQHTTVVSSTGVPGNRQLTALDLSVQSARVGLEYQAPLKWLSAEVELEATNRPELKDAYVRAKQKHWDVRAGQFKMPIGAFEMESPWDLPLVRGGFVHEILTDRLDIAGRRPGVALGLRAGGALKPGLTLGVFQGSALASQTTDDRDTDLIERQGLNAQTQVARAHIRADELKLGLSYQHRLGAPSLGKTRHLWTTGLDLFWQHTHEAGGLRLWADLMAGQSWYEHPGKPDDGDDAVFAAVRALVAYRFGGLRQDDLYIESFLFAAAHDPDMDVVVDLAAEAAVGVAGGFWDRARLVLQAEAYAVRRNFPSSYSFGTDPDRLALLLQAGVSF